MNAVVTPTQTGVRVSLPMKVRNRRGRTEIPLPDLPRHVERESPLKYQEAIAIAVARGPWGAEVWLSPN